MICIPIMPRSNAEARAMLEFAAAEPADIYELRFDRLEETPDVEGLLAAADRPVIATCRSSRQGGFFAGTTEARRAILQRAMDAGAAYVDAEEDVIAGLRRREGTIVIASWHDFTRVPDDLPKIAARLAELPCDWAKFAVAAHKAADNLKVFEAVAACPKPAIGIAMGEIGFPTRVLGPAYGSKVTYGGLAAGLESAPGQPTARDLAEVYRVKSLSRETAVYGLIGDPVAQSLGYRLHNLGFASAGLDAVYIPFQCPDAADFLSTLPDRLNIRGLSVTMPHKHAALEWAASATEAAKRIGAANTLIKDSDGWRADNTDYHAARAAVETVARENGVALRGRPALVLGTGGVAKAIAAGLSVLGCGVTIAGRDGQKAERLAEALGCAAMPWDDREKGDWTVVANATPLGMHPNEDAAPFSASAWKRGMIAFDSVYRPRMTRFLREAETAGALTVDGFDMFIRQAAGQFALWTGLELPKECRAHALDWMAPAPA